MPLAASSSVAELESALQRAESKLAERDAQNEALRKRNAELTAELKKLRREFTAFKSEVKRLLEHVPNSKQLIDEGQLSLFDGVGPEELAPEETPEHADEAPDGETPDDSIRGRHKPKKRAKKTDTSLLPRETVVHGLDEHERVCPETGVLLVEVGVEVFEELDYVGAKLRVLEHHRIIYGPPPEVAEERKIAPITAPLPARPLEGCKASASLLAYLLIQKYQFHCVPRRRTQLPKGVRPKARRSESCCTEDEGRPFEIGVQAQVSNRLELRGSRARVVSVEGNGVVRPRQVRSKETNASEPLMTCREVFTRRRNRAGWLARDKSRGHLSTDWMASGMKAA